MKWRLGKRIAKHPLAQTVLCALVAAYIRLTVATMRIRREVAPESAPYLSGEQQGIFAFWHGRILLMPTLIPPRRKMQVLVSGHSDGVLISKVVAWFDVGTVEGSTSKKSTSALRGLLRAVKAGDNIGISPDGPRGPRQEAAPGVVYVAKTTGLPVIPTTWSASPSKCLRSWDRFMIPLPFSRGMLVVGAPVRIEKSLTEDAACTLLADVLNTLTRQADAAMGVVSQC